MDTYCQNLDLKIKKEFSLRKKILIELRLGVGKRTESKPIPQKIDEKKNSGT